MNNGESRSKHVVHCTSFLSHPIILATDSLVPVCISGSEGMEDENDETAKKFEL